MQKLFQVGHIPWSKGKTFSAEYRQKISASKKGKIREDMRGDNNPMRRAEIVAQFIGDKNPAKQIRVRQKLREYRTGRPMLNYRGDKTYCWKGGITPINLQIRHSLEYQNWRRTVFARDDYRCYDCGVKGVEIHKKVLLQAHHIYPFAQYPRLRFMPENGITLCIDCHRNKSRKSKIN